MSIVRDAQHQTHTHGMEEEGGGIECMVLPYSEYMGEGERGVRETPSTTSHLKSCDAALEVEATSTRRCASEH